MARTKKADQEKSAGKTEKKTTKGLEAPEQEQAPMPEPEAPEQEQTQDQTPEPDMFANLPNPCVYCGPSIKGVARQYTTYQGGISDALREFIKAHPDALGLIVPTGKFQAMRKRLETHGTREAKLYKAVKAGL